MQHRGQRSGLLPYRQHLHRQFWKYFGAIQCGGQGRPFANFVDRTRDAARHISIGDGAPCNRQGIHERGASGKDRGEGARQLDRIMLHENWSQNGHAQQELVHGESASGRDIVHTTCKSKNDYPRQSRQNECLAPRHQIKQQLRGKR